MALKEVCDVSLRFKFNVEKNAEIGKIALCAENPEKYNILINGKELNFCDEGYYTDKSIRKTDIGDLVCEGENEIIMNCHFYQEKVSLDISILFQYNPFLQTQ